MTSAIDTWIVNADGSENRQLTVNQDKNFAPVVSPDGRYIVFISTRAGNSNIWRMEIDGGNQTTLTDTPEDESNPNFTPDGKWIVYNRKTADNLTTVWKVSADGGEPVQLTETQTYGPKVSPDGKVFICAYGKTQPKNPPKLAIIPIEGGEPRQLFDLSMIGKSSFYRWSPDGKALIYIENRNRASNLWSKAFDDSPPKQLTFFESGQIAGFSFTRDSKDLAISRGNESSDVVMMSNF